MISKKLNEIKRYNILDKEFSNSFGLFLIEKKAIEDISFQRALAATEKSDERFDSVLTKLGILSEDDLYNFLAQFLTIPRFDIRELHSKPNMIDNIPVSFLKLNRIIPISIDKSGFIIGITDPLNLEPVDALAYLTKLEISVCLLTPEEFDKTWSSLYSPENRDFQYQGERRRYSDSANIDLQKLKDIANQAPIVLKVNEIISNAVEAHASDIHIEPTDKSVRIRFRIDGSLVVVETLSLDYKSAIASRIKVMARLNIAESRLPQDGRIEVVIRGIDIDFRVSTIPTSYGESIVLRILDRSKLKLTFETLGFSEKTINDLRNILHNPNGIVLVTGPTGSGKTTTLYSALSELSKPEVKIFTVEDPIEYQLEGINQIAIQPMIGLDFPKVLRAILRQDPNIIMIGEIRDSETARIAIQAALTGQLVLSTLHTNSATASITRLKNMGIESYLIASTLKAVLSQRLVRKLCQKCSITLTSHEVWRERFKNEDFAKKPEKLLSAVGCIDCRSSGYTGRSTISELFILDEKVQTLISKDISESDLETFARDNGMETLYYSGMSKAWSGETSIEEVMRVTRID